MHRDMRAANPDAEHYRLLSEVWCCARWGTGTTGSTPLSQSLWMLLVVIERPQSDGEGSVRGPVAISPSPKPHPKGQWTRQQHS